MPPSGIQTPHKDDIEETWVFYYHISLYPGPSEAWIWEQQS